ncbi:MAG TPA: LamG-like jellyroll fold domain-containing protein [Pirellulales bacterium]|nr:LamG-like jellyroll fold domain-containing protein [Pirellulales bacterium]
MQQSITVLGRALLALIFLSASHANADIITGLVDYWPLDETSGSIAHDVVGGNNATLSGFPVNQATWVPGKVGGSLNFFAASNYVITDAPISSNQYTIDFWLKVNGPGGLDPRLIGPRDGFNSWIVINSIFDRGVGFYTDFTPNSIQDPNPPVTGVWENYATTIDLGAKQVAIYRDGIEVASGTFNDHVPLADWVFGHNQGPGNTNDTLNGQLDEIRIYNRILSPTDIMQLVPEPNSFVLAGLGFFGLAVWGWRHRHHSACISRENGSH